MGYHTDFEGKFNLNKPLDRTLHLYLLAFSKTRRMAWEGLPEIFGIEGEYYVGGQFQDWDTTNGYWADDAKVIDYNRHPKTQPGLWCQWVPTDDGMAIVWNEHEKFYNYLLWLQYLIGSFLKPNDYVLNGEMHYRGEDIKDNGKITVINNVITSTGSASGNGGW